VSHQGSHQDHRDQHGHSESIGHKKWDRHHGHHHGDLYEPDADHEAFLVPNAIREKQGEGLNQPRERGDGGNAGNVRCGQSQPQGIPSKDGTRHHRDLGIRAPEPSHIEEPAQAFDGLSFGVFWFFFQRRSFILTSGTKVQRHRGTEAQRHKGAEAQRHRGKKNLEKGSALSAVQERV